MQRRRGVSVVAFVAILSVILSGLMGCPASAQVNYEVLKRGVVKIVGHTPGGGEESGAGIVVGLDGNIALIVTAYHVVKDANKIEVVFFDKQYREFQGKPFKKYHEDLDLMVITVDLGTGTSVPADLLHFTLGNVATLRQGETVSTIGHPLKHEWQASIKTNTIAGLSDQEDSRKFRFTKTAVDRGNSGGPVLNEQGALIGMVTKLEPIYAVAVKIDTVLSVLGEEWRIPVWWRSEERKTTLTRELVTQAVETRTQLAKRKPDEESTYLWYLLTKDDRRDLLQRSVLLAVEAMQRFPSPEAEQALRGGLAWLTRPVRRMEHDGHLTGIAFSPDGKYLATASSDKTARVWEATSGREVARMVHQEGVQAIVFSPDGKNVATASDDRTARVWEATSGREVARMVHQEGVQAIAFSPDGKNLATASDDRTARVWDAASGREVARMTHQVFMRMIAFSPEGKYVATASGDTASADDVRSTAWVWEASSGREVARLTHEQRNVNTVAFSSAGKYVATGGGDGTARIWEANSGREVARMRHKSSVQAVTFSPDGKYLATGSSDGTARIWEVPSGREVARLPHGDRVITVTFSSDSKYLATGSQDGTARVLKATGEEMPLLALLAPGGGNVEAVAFSPDGKYLATQSQSDTALTWLVFPDDLIVEACARLSRNLRPEEWRQYLGDEPRHKTCANLP